MPCLYRTSTSPYKKNKYGATSGLRRLQLSKKPADTWSLEMMKGLNSDAALSVQEVLCRLGQEESTPCPRRRTRDKEPEGEGHLERAGCGLQARRGI